MYIDPLLWLQVVPVLKEDANVVKQAFLDQASTQEIDLNEVRPKLYSNH